MCKLERYNTILQTLDVHVFMCIINYFLHVLSLKPSKLSLLETKYPLGNYSDFSRLSIFISMFGTEDPPEHNNKWFPFQRAPSVMFWGLMVDITDSACFSLDAAQ